MRAAGALLPRLVVSSHSSANRPFSSFLVRCFLVHCFLVRCFLVTCLLTLCTSCLVSKTPPRGPVLPDLDGRLHSPTVADGKNATVVVFVTTDCPIANSYAPELRAIVNAHANDPVRFFFVHVDRELTTSAAQAHAKELGMPGIVLLDREHVLLRDLGGEVTPEAFVITKGGELVYRGRIDERWVSLGVRKEVVEKRELREVIGEVVRGRVTGLRRTEAVGCVID